MIERIWSWLADRLPRRLVYWCGLRILMEAKVVLEPVCSERKITCFRALTLWAMREDVEKLLKADAKEAERCPCD